MLQHDQEIGKLDRRITFQSKIIGSNESNEDAEEGWEDIENNPTVWGSLSQKTGVEKYAADRLTGFQGAEIVVRFRDDLNIKMRAVCDDVAYNIISIAEIGRKRYTKVVTESGYDYVEDES